MLNKFEDLKGNFIEKVKKNILDYNLIQEGDVVMVGVSGGPDSMALLSVLNSLRSELGFSVVALHLNHMLRGAEADRDEQYVEEYCRQNGVQFINKCVDVKKEADLNSLSIEEAARVVRYSFFYEEQKKFDLSKLAVAHNRNDQAETVLMNIIRGTGTDGLRGMKFIRKCEYDNRFDLIRPLLNIDRSEIEKYCESEGIIPRVDSSNLETEYTRNKVRINLIPMINREFACDITKNLVRLSGIVEDEAAFLREISEESEKKISLKVSEQEINVNILEFNLLHDAIKKRVVRQIINKIKGNLKQVENINIENVIILSKNGKTGNRIQLPGDIIVVKSYKELKFKVDDGEKKKVNFEKRLNLSGDIVVEGVGRFTVVIEKKSDLENEIGKFDQKAFVQRFDFDKIREMEIFIRNRRDGDRFKPFGSNGTKKLKEYFIDEKIEREDRENLALMVCNNEVLWIVGFVISDKYKVTERTKDILRIKFEKV